MHTNSTKPGIIARISARLAGIKRIIHTVHGIAVHKYNSIPVRLFYWLVENLATMFGSVNVSVNKYYSKFYPLAKSITIYNGVDFSSLSKPESKLLIGDLNKSAKIDSEVHIAFMARLDKQKNPLDFIKMADFVLSHYDGNKKIRFTLAGDGELRQECERIIDELGLKGVVQVPGWIKDKSKFLSTVTVLCQTSRWEAFGLNFVEAAFYKIPAVASDVEGIPEVVVDNFSGLLFKDGDLTAFSHQVLKLVNDECLVSKLGNNAYDRAVKKFNKDTMVENYISIYSESISSE